MKSDLLSKTFRYGWQSFLNQKSDVFNGAQIDDVYACEEIYSISLLSCSDPYNFQLNVVSITDNSDVVRCCIQ